MTRSMTRTINHHRSTRFTLGLVALCVTLVGCSTPPPIKPARDRAAYSKALANALAQAANTATPGMVTVTALQATTGTAPMPTPPRWVTVSVADVVAGGLRVETGTTGSTVVLWVCVERGFAAVINSACPSI